MKSKDHHEHIAQAEGQSTDNVTPQIVSGPTPDDLKLGEREIRLMEELFDWGERSAKTHWVLGKPYGS